MKSSLTQKEINKNIEDIVKEKEIDEVNKKSISSINSITGGKNHLYNYLKDSFKRASSVDIIVSFLMESGVKMIIEDIKEAIDRGVKVRILTGNYLEITQPSALAIIKKEFKEKVDLRFYNVPKKSFHPKSYIFHGKEDSEIYIGSSNISKGALTDSIEWNYRLLKSQNPNDFINFYNTFEDLFNNHSIKITDEVLSDYSKNWVRPSIYKDLEKNEEEKVIKIFEPRGAQIEALYSLEKSREEGFDKAIVVAATGIGKTYLAAFDSLKYKRVLFVAHREEIIKQAAQSFKNVRNNEEVGFFYNNRKDTDKNLIFALVQTLGKEAYLNEEYFAKDYFDYIIVDEFHHAVSTNYKRIMEYFTPKFLLGLTATPERLDSKDVFALCDYNEVYEVRLQEAINKGWLVPFRYYGIYDKTVDYKTIDYKKGKYDNKELEKALMLNKRAELILKHYEKYKSKRAFGFCTSRAHAEYMAKYFNENKIKSVAVYSGEKGEFSEERDEAIRKLVKGELQVIFSVDMFNEGLDVPSIDLVMFLRPTESPTIFLQQLGRGLRKAPNKEYLTVLDFIGNYKRADMLPFLLSGKEYTPSKSKKGKTKEFEYPKDCIVDFDFEVMDIFKKLAEKEIKIETKVKEEYIKIKEMLGHRPTRVDFLTYIEESLYKELKGSKRKYNPLNNYLQYLKDNDELTEEEEKLYNSRGREFINMIETTAMTKTYKMPLFLAFYNEGNIKMEITEEDIYKSFYNFYHKGSNKVDMLKDKSTRDFENWEKKDYIKLAKNNPIKFMLKTHGDFFKEKEESIIALQKDLKEIVKNKSFKENMIDAIEYRVKDYYRNRNFK